MKVKNLGETMGVSIQYPYRDKAYGPEVEPTAYGLASLITNELTGNSRTEQACELWHKIYFIVAEALDNPDTIPVRKSISV